MRKISQTSGRTFKFAVVALVLIGSAMAGSMHFVPRILNASMERVLRRVIPAPPGSRAVVKISGVSLRLPLELRVGNLSFSTVLPASPTLARPYRAAGDCQGLRIRGVKRGRWDITAERMAFEFNPADPTVRDQGSDPQISTVSVRDLSATVFLEPWPVDRLKKGVGALRNSVNELLQKGKVRMDLTCEGRILTRLEGIPVEIKFDIHPFPDGTAGVRLDRKDIEALGNLTEEGLTSSEVDLLLAHPMKAPRLLAIQQHATRTAKEKAAQDPGFPQDAYRHVLWSFKLTRAFGADFALKVTDAHEKGSGGILIETDADRAMDLNNNRIGIGYALDGLDASLLIEKILTDPGIIRSPADPSL